MFGIGTKKARLHVESYVNMLGQDDHSWVLSHKGLLWNGGRHKTYIKPFKSSIPTKIGLYFDRITGTLSYWKDGVSLGVAFTNLQHIKEPLFPIVSSSSRNTIMSLGVLKRDFHSLQDRCRSSILYYLTHKEQINQLKLPLMIKDFIFEGMENSEEN